MTKKRAKALSFKTEVVRAGTNANVVVALDYGRYGFPVLLYTSSSATDERKFLKSSSPHERQSSLRSDGQ